MSLEKALNFMDLGLTSYRDTQNLQEELYRLRKGGEIGDTVLFIEYRPIITLGKYDFWNKIHSTEEGLRNKGIEVHKEDRGGGTAYLGPGQLIVYLILNLREHGLSIFDYHILLERLAGEAAEHFGIAPTFEDIRLETDLEKGPKGKIYRSVWFKDENGKNHKFFAQGHRIPDKNTTKYGMVLYIQQKGLEHMNLVNQCGFDDEQVGTVSFEGLTKRDIPMEEAKKVVLGLIKKSLNYDAVKKLKFEEVNRNAAP